MSDRNVAMPSEAVSYNISSSLTSCVLALTRLSGCPCCSIFFRSDETFSDEDAADSDTV